MFPLEGSVDLINLNVIDIYNWGFFLIMGMGGREGRNMFYIFLGPNPMLLVYPVVWWYQNSHHCILWGRRTSWRSPWSIKYLLDLPLTPTMGPIESALNSRSRTKETSVRLQGLGGGRIRGSLCSPFLAPICLLPSPNHCHPFTPSPALLHPENAFPSHEITIAIPTAPATSREAQHQMAGSSLLMLLVWWLLQCALWHIYGSHCLGSMRMSKGLDCCFSDCGVGASFRWTRAAIS